MDNSLLQYKINTLSVPNGCGSLLVDRDIEMIVSPGYPDRYPRNMDCNYTLPIPNGTVMAIVLYDFDLEYHSSCK